MKIAQNQEANITPNMFQPKMINNQERMNKITQVYDDEFISLINGLNESIKEYYKVSRNNINEANSFLSFYEQQGKSIQTLMDEIINSNSYDRINEVFEQIPKINEIMAQLQMNSNSNEHNLNLFFEDAKILFKKMKIMRKQKMVQMNNYNSNNNQVLNDSFSNSFNVNQPGQAGKINLIKKNNGPNPFSKINPNRNSFITNSILLNINNKYSQIINLLNNFSEFNFMINKMNFEASNRYSNLQINIKKELDTLINYVKNSISSIGRNSSSKNNRDEQSLNQRSKSIPNRVGHEIEELRRINLMNEKKIKDLSSQLNSLRSMNSMSNMNSNSDSKYKSQIVNLQQELSVYKSNEGLLNSQIIDLNNKIQMKIKLYESQLSLINKKCSSLNQMILDKNKEILKYQSETNESKKEIDKLKKIIHSQRMSNTNANINYIQEYEETIKNMQNEINNYKNMINEYENQIMQFNNMNNNNNGINMNSNNNMGNNNILLQKKIEMLNREIQKKEKEYQKEREMMINRNSLNAQKNNAINTQNHKIIEEQKLKINQLNKEIINSQKKEKINEEKINKYIKQIEDLNNNILKTNTIMEQKDELIKQLNEEKSGINRNNNNINLDYKNEGNNLMNQQKINNLVLENEKLRKENEDLKNYNNNLLLNNQIVNGNNVQQLNNMGTNEYIAKIKELTLENQKSKESLASTKESILKLENDINKKNEELQGLRDCIFKLQDQLEKKDDNKFIEEIKKEKKSNIINMRQGENEHLSMTERKDKKISHTNNKSFEAPKDADTAMISNILNKLNDAEKKISTLQNKNKELQYQLEEKQVEKDISGYRTEDVNFSNYEEEFDLKKMVNGARDKNRSEDINIDYPGVQGIKDKYKELLQNMNMLEEQVKILLCNISCTNKIKPQITQICQIMRIPAKNIQLIIAGKDKKKALGLIG